MNKTTWNLCHHKEPVERFLQFTRFYVWQYSPLNGFTTSVDNSVGSPYPTKIKVIFNNKINENKTSSSLSQEINCCMEFSFLCKFLHQAHKNKNNNNKNLISLTHATSPSLYPLKTASFLFQGAYRRAAIILFITNISSIPSQKFYNKGVLKHFAKFTGNNLCWSSFLIKFFLKKTLPEVFSYDFRKSFKDTFSTKHQRATASVVLTSNSNQLSEVQRSWFLWDGNFGFQWVKTGVFYSISLLKSFYVPEKQLWCHPHWVTMLAASSYRRHFSGKFFYLSFWIIRVTKIDHFNIHIKNNNIMAWLLGSCH